MMDNTEFRMVFEANKHLLNVLRADGTNAIAVGLNGDNAVMHGGDELPLGNLIDSRLGFLVEQENTDGS